jgi:hypothetical protein
VVLLNRKDPAKPRFIVLGSTDPELNGHKLVELYTYCISSSDPGAFGDSDAFRSRC